MTALLKIHNINPSYSMGLENRLNLKKEKHGEKAYLSENKADFADYLEAQLKDKDFASRFNKD